MSLRNFSWPGIEVLENLKAGLPLMVGAMAGSLIIGVVRLGIAGNWSVAVFGQVALALSLAGLVLTAVVAVGQVLFPLLRRVSVDRLPGIYSVGRTISSVLTIPALSLYFALVPFISCWLPEYKESAHYLGMLFPLFVFQVRTSVLLEPYLKTLRREKTLFGVNLGVLSLSVFFTWMNVYMLDNLDAALISIVVLVALRALVFEFVVSRLMNVRFAAAAFSELLVVGVFLLGVIYWDTHWALVALLVSIGLWFVFRSKDIAFAIRSLRV